MKQGQHHDKRACGISNIDSFFSGIISSVVDILYILFVRIILEYKEKQKLFNAINFQLILDNLSVIPYISTVYLCRSGEIGRRAGFKILWNLVPCGFDSHLRHH